MSSVYRKSERNLYVYLVYAIEDDGHVSVAGVFDSPDKAHSYADKRDKELSYLERKSVLFHVEERKVQ